MNNWHQWRAWHPIYTHDAGMIWAWPWSRVPVWGRMMFTVNGMYTQWAGEVPPIEYYKEKPK